MTRDDCLDLDARDPLAAHRQGFALPEDLIYLDGNSLGALPRATAPRLAEVITAQWGGQLIRGWNGAGWAGLPRQVGGAIAALVGASPDEVVCTDSTSMNLFKVLAAALRLQHARPQVSMRERRLILSERGNFPTDLYIAQGLADLLGGRFELKTVPAAEIPAALDDSVAVLMLTHVNYRTGAMHDMAGLTRLAHAAGALTVWDLAHSAGAVPIRLDGCAADFAVGCGYKYLNGGPGAPAFLYVAARHLHAMREGGMDGSSGVPRALRFAQPLAGWFGHRAPFAFDGEYEPADSIDRFCVGTPPVLGLAALACGVETVAAAGIDALRDKSVQLTEQFIEQVERRCAGLGLTLVTPRAPARRGSQVCFSHADAWPVMQALVARGVIGDFRAPDILRFGFAPLYVRHVDVWDAVEVLHAVLTDPGRPAGVRPPAGEVT